VITFLVSVRGDFRKEEMVLLAVPLVVIILGGHRSGLLAGMVVGEEVFHFSLTHESLERLVEGR